MSDTDTNTNTDTDTDTSTAAETDTDPVDPEDIDFESEADTWIGDPAEEMYELETLNGQVKRFLLSEPSDINPVIRAFMKNDDRRLVSFVVDKPDMTPERWRKGLTGTERARLYGECCDFLDLKEILGDMVDMDAVAAELAGKDLDELDIDTDASDE